MNRDNHQEVAIDFSAQPPEVTVAACDTGSAAELLAIGEPATVVIADSKSLETNTPAGIDLFALVLTVMVPGKEPYRVQVGNPVPPVVLPLLFPGSNVFAMVHPVEPDRVVIDWDQALQD